MRRDVGRPRSRTGDVAGLVAVSLVDVDVDGDGDDFEDNAFVGSSRWYPMLSFQRLDVYRCAIDFFAFAATLAEATPRGYGHVADQLRRASLSVPLNIAEAAGRVSGTDAARHYGIARGSAMECAAVMDALRALKVIDDERYAHAMELLGRIVAMLTKLSR